MRTKAWIIVASLAGAGVLASCAGSSGGSSNAASDSGVAALMPKGYTLPTSRVEPVKETIHGVEVVDNYRWLEGDNSNPKAMGARTPEVDSWTDAQNAYTRSLLDNLPGRKALEEKLRPLMEVGSVSTPFMTGDASKNGGRYFYFKREGNQNQPLVYVRDGWNGPSRVLLDPAKLDPSGLTTISWISPTEDGTLLAYGTYVAGNEESVANVVKVDTGEKLPVTVTGKVASLDWLPDNSGFFYRNLSDVKNPYSGQLMFRRLAAKAGEQDLQVIRQFTPEENKELATTYGPYGGVDKKGQWLILSYYTDTRNNDLWVAPVADFLKTGRAQRTEISVGEKAESSATIVNGFMYMQTTLDAPNGRIVKRGGFASGATFDKSQSLQRVIVPERKDAVIQGFSVAKGVLAVNYLKNASSLIELFDLDGKPKGTLKLPGIGTASLATEQDRTEAFLSFFSYNYPTTVFRVDLANPTAEPVVWERPDAPVDPASVEVKQEWYTSKDGTRVSMFIIHKKGLKLDGNNPTVLYGYGGFNVSETPRFVPHLFQWFDAGGVYAIANLRGGGEYGNTWHESGRLANKQNVFDDFYAACEHLIARKYTNPNRLAVRGGSNGGLLTGTAVTQRPELFRAAIVGVPLLDMVRYQYFLMARYWVPEYGSAEDAKQFGWIYPYSPYHNIKEGTRYPAVFITAGENDTRVHPLHARKMAAALQAATGSNQAERPVLLWVDREAGHGQGKPLNLRIREVADERIFLMWQLGMLGS